MRKEHLRIGDYFKIGPDVSSVNELREDKVIYKNRYGITYETKYYNSSIRPVKLTPEILEDNGFKYENGSYYLDGLTARVLIIFDKSMESYYLRVSDENGQMERKMKNMYVHKLQHIFDDLDIDYPLSIKR